MYEKKSDKKYYITDNFIVIKLIYITVCDKDTSNTRVNMMKKNSAYISCKLYLMNKIMNI